MEGEPVMEFVGLRRKDYSGLLFWGFTLPEMETSGGFAQLVREAGVGGHMAPSLCWQQHPSSTLCGWFLCSQGGSRPAPRGHQGPCRLTLSPLSSHTAHLGPSHATPFGFLTCLACSLCF